MKKYRFKNLVFIDARKYFVKHEEKDELGFTSISYELKKLKDLPKDSFLIIPRELMFACFQIEDMFDNVQACVTLKSWVNEPTSIDDFEILVTDDLRGN